MPELVNDYGLSIAQTQIIFGTVIGVFTLTMMGVTKLMQKIGMRWVILLSGLLYLSGYVVAFLSKGNFYALWAGIGLLGGIGTGMGYLVSLSVPVKCFPEKKGLVTGLIVAGFGAGAIVLSYIADFLLQNGIGVLQIFLYSGLLYGGIIMLSALKITEPETVSANNDSIPVKIKKAAALLQLILGIFSGTFTGLLVIGNLKPIAQNMQISASLILMSISIFAFSNFAGRITWGWLSDRIKNTVLIPVSLIAQALAAMALLMPLSDLHFVGIISVIGFCFGAHFVLFARDTIQKFGIYHYGVIYPFIFLGYGLAGVVGPLIGGWLVDVTGTYTYAIYLTVALSAVSAIVYLLLQTAATKQYD